MKLTDDEANKLIEMLRLLEKEKLQLEAIQFIIASIIKVILKNRVQ